MIKVWICLRVGTLGLDSLVGMTALTSTQQQPIDTLALLSPWAGVFLFNESLQDMLLLFVLYPLPRHFKFNRKKWRSCWLCEREKSSALLSAILPNGKMLIDLPTTAMQKQSSERNEEDKMKMKFHKGNDNHDGLSILYIHHCCLKSVLRWFY